MNLEEWLEKWPLGSNWMMGSIPVKVVGCDPEHHYPLIVRSEKYNLDNLSLSGANNLKPAP